MDLPGSRFAMTPSQWLASCCIVVQKAARLTVGDKQVQQNEYTDSTCTNARRTFCVAAKVGHPRIEVLVSMVTVLTLMCAILTSVCTILAPMCMETYLHVMQG